MKMELENGLDSKVSEENIKLLNDYNKNYDNDFSSYNLKLSLDLSFKFLDALNLYVTQKEPWTLMKDESKLEEVKEIMYTICE